MSSISENDVDGEAFFLLEERDINELFSALGTRRKFIAKRKQQISVPMVNIIITTCVGSMTV